MKRTLNRLADRIDDDFVDRIDRGSRILAWAAVILALVAIILPAIFTIAFK